MRCFVFVELTQTLRKVCAQNMDSSISSEGQWPAITGLPQRSRHSLGQQLDLGLEDVHDIYDIHDAILLLHHTAHGLHGAMARDRDTHDEHKNI